MHIERCWQQILRLLVYEKSEYCVHSYAVDVLVTEDDPQIDEVDTGEQGEMVVDFLSLDPLLVAADPVDKDFSTKWDKTCSNQAASSSLECIC